MSCCGCFKSQTCHNAADLKRPSCKVWLRFNVIMSFSINAHHMTSVRWLHPLLGWTRVSTHHNSWTMTATVLLFLLLLQLHRAHSSLRVVSAGPVQHRGSGPQAIIQPLCHQGQRRCALSHPASEERGCFCWGNIQTPHRDVITVLVFGAEVADGHLK